VGRGIIEVVRGMNQKEIPALAIMLMLWAACAAAGTGALAHQSVRLEVVPAVEAAVRPLSGGPSELYADRASWRAVPGDASLVVTPGTFHGKVTVSSEAGAFVEVGVEAFTEASGPIKTVVRLTLTDP
jgi:hypothetical protein